MTQKIVKSTFISDYPRASSFYAYANCRASYLLSKASGEEPPTPHSDRGTEVHGVISGKIDPATTTEAVVSEATTLKMQKLSFFEHWLSGSYQEHVEERLWLRTLISVLYSGQPDVWARGVTSKGKPGPNAALSDYKTGWHPLDAYVATNCQIRAYAALIHTTTGWELEQLVAMIHKPGHPLAPAVFDREALDEALEWSTEIAKLAIESVKAKKMPDPTRGPWCKYCSGKVLCPLWKEELSQLADFADIGIGEIPDSQLRALAPSLELAAQVIDRLQARLRHRVRDRPEFFPDWKFAKGDTRRKIEDVVECYNRLCVENQHLSPGEFLATCRIAITELEERLKHKLGLTFLATRAFMDQKLNGVMDTKLNADKLVYDPQPIPNQPEALPEKTK